MKKLLCIAICLMVVILNCVTIFAQTNDYENHWAKEEIEFMKEKGVVSGYPDGTFRPNNNMTKAEFYKVINMIMGYIHKSEVNFTDVNSGLWYYDEVKKGVGANYILPTESLKADDKISRGEVARILGIVFEIEGDKQETAKFKDNNSIPEGLKAVIGGLKKNGYIDGYPDGTFRVNGEITRAEVVKMLRNITGEIVNKKAEINENVPKNIVVNTSDVILKDMEIAGNLYLTEGIGEGLAHLDSVKVKGLTTISGGGANTIEIKNSELKALLVNKRYSPVKVVFINTKLESAKGINQAKLHLKDASSIKTLELKDKAELVVEGKSTVENLTITSKDVVVNCQGTINSFKSTTNIKINGTEIKANMEYKIVEGKIIEPNTGGSNSGGYIPDPGPNPPEVDKEKLQNAISDANINKSTVSISVDGSDVENTKKWVTKEVMDDYEKAIKKASGILNKANLTQEEVNNAVTELDLATKAFDGAKKYGTKEGPVPTIAVGYKETSNLSYLVKISVKVNNIIGASKFDVVFYTNDNNKPIEMVTETKANINEESEAIWYDIEFRNTITIRIYDANDQLIYTFENIIPIKAN